MPNKKPSVTAPVFSTSFNDQAETNKPNRSTDACIQCWLKLKYVYKIKQRFVKYNRQQNLSEYSGLDHIEVEEVHFGDDGDVKKENGLYSEEMNQIEEVVERNNIAEVKVDQLCSAKSVKNLHKIETNSDNKVTPCRICGDPIFDTEMLDHTKSHFFSRLKCDQCNMYCNNIESYRNHVAQAHANRLSRIWTCKNCNATFSYKPLYLIHHNKAHRKRLGLSLKLKFRRDENKPHNCPHCNKRFYNEVNCLQHLKTHNKKKCDICGAFVSQTNFGTHLRTHEEKPVCCHICGVYYKNSVCLRSHIHYTHSTSTYLCEFCQKIFKKSYTLSMHIKREHTGEKSHVCDECGKRFFTFFNLNTHKKMTHLKLRPHVCQYCDKKFSSKFARVTHERQHTNVKPYKCEICGQGYRQNVSLKSHKKSAHDIVEELTCECEVCGKKFASNFAIISHMRLH